MKNRNLMYLAAALLAAIVVGYPAGAWFVGKQIEAKFTQDNSALHDYVPFATVSDHKFERGLFSSQDTMTVNLVFPPAQTPVRITITSRIRHLPIPGVFALHAADMDSDVKIEGDLAAEVAAMTAGQSPASIHTALYFSGGGSSTLTIPALKSEALTSDQATLNVTFSRDMATYSAQGNAPKFTITDKSGAKVQISGVTFSGDHQRIMPELPSLYAGSDRFTVEQVEASGQGVTDGTLIRHLTAEATATQGKDSEFVDIAEKFKVDSLKVMGGEYAPAELDLTFRHLHAKTIASFSRTNWIEADKNPMLMMGYMEALFTHDPEFTIDRLSFTRPEGETVLSALFKIQGAQPGDFSNPGALVSKGYVSVDLKAPEKLISAFSQTPFAPPALHGGGFDNMMGKLLAVGYVTREGDYLKTRFEFHDAKPWLNGKEFAPQAMR